MSLRKIISGGQTGADQGGLVAGKKLLLETGGTAPPGWMTEDGPFPELESHFGLVEGLPDPKIYVKRTEANVLDADGTILFGKITSPGTRLTLRYCIRNAKPHISNPTVQELRDFVDVFEIEVLNIAGNRESKKPGIAGKTTDLIVEAFGEV